MRKILIVGANSAIAVATAHIWAKQGNYLFLASRNKAKLEVIANDFRIKGCPNVWTYCMDANDFDAHVPMLDAAEAAMGGVDTVLIAHGTLSNQKTCQESVELTIHEIKTNALSVISLLTHIANRFEKQQQGTIAVISSVAGERGRQSNYVYGSAKAMVTSFTSGLRQRLFKVGVSVLTIKPGFVDTPMTQGFRKTKFWVRPEVVARGIVSAIDANKDEIYLPAWWKIVMLVIKAIPNAIFKRMFL